MAEELAVIFESGYQEPELFSCWNPSSVAHCPHPTWLPKKQDKGNKPKKTFSVWILSNSLNARS